MYIILFIRPINDYLLSNINSATETTFFVHVNQLTQTSMTYNTLFNMQT